MTEINFTNSTGAVRTKFADAEIARLTPAKRNELARWQEASAENTAAEAHSKACDLAVRTNMKAVAAAQEALEKFRPKITPYMAQRAHLKSIGR